ncbi:MAG: CRISPR-associated ring nuclease [candidate division KSB1 bacterium]|nr:CRISPR-associated ring nuclease [candidate division KSB1 bacterium]
MKTRLNRNGHQAKFLGTLGTAPQIFTITLDLLLKEHIPVSEAVLIHTDNDDSKKAVDEIKREFQKGTYPGIQLRPLPVASGRQRFEDIDDEHAFHCLMQIFFEEIQQAHARGQVVHIGIAGGRKVMAIAAMVIAQLLFQADDGLWHLFSDFYDRDDQRLHAVPEQHSRLMRVPVLRYGNASQLLAAFPQLGDVASILRLQEQWLEGEKMRRRREFVQRWLTAAEQDVVKLVCCGLDNATIARRLHKSEKTVSNQLSRVYGKLQELLQSSEFDGPSVVDRSVLIAILAPYFALQDIAHGNGAP